MKNGASKGDAVFHILTLCGHRLPSLYRSTIRAHLSHHAKSMIVTLLKISSGVQGADSPLLSSLESRIAHSISYSVYSGTNS